MSTLEFLKVVFISCWQVPRLPWYHPARENSCQALLVCLITKWIALLKHFNLLANFRLLIKDIWFHLELVLILICCTHSWDTELNTQREILHLTIRNTKSLCTSNCNVTTKLTRRLQYRQCKKISWTNC